MNNLTTSVYKSHLVKVGDVSLGGGVPVVAQSMCNTAPDDVVAGVEQAEALAFAGSELVRFTVRNSADAVALGHIREQLRARNVAVPIVADVHFNAEAALEAAALVDKVRVNPGNFIDKRAVFKSHEYSDSEWDAELFRLAEAFDQLADLCLERGTALRVGVNHGSLSDRIMSRYGNTVRGMVESAMEFLRLAARRGMRDVVVSLKSSNVRVMVTAYRALVRAMQSEGISFPLHLGVTEAGDGLPGRVRSAVGIGALLLDGIGDTIRVSLTETPVNEIPVAQKLIQHAALNGRPQLPMSLSMLDDDSVQILDTHSVGCVGGKNLPVVVVDAGTKQLDKSLLCDLGYQCIDGAWCSSDRAADFVLIDQIVVDSIPCGLSVLYRSGSTAKPCPEAIPVYLAEDYLELSPADRLSEKWIRLSVDELNNSEIRSILASDRNAVLMLSAPAAGRFASVRRAFFDMRESGWHLPVIVEFAYDMADAEACVVAVSADAGALFLDGMGNGLCVSCPAAFGVVTCRELSFEILQASRARGSRAEIVACPSCGRTLFDIQAALAAVRARMSHLKRLKIAVMGCVVNGPGEMADADYGYVGAAPGKVCLYVGKTLVHKNIEQELAIDELEALIRSRGDWEEPR